MLSEGPGSIGRAFGVCASFKRRMSRRLSPRAILARFVVDLAWLCESSQSTQTVPGSPGANARVAARRSSVCIHNKVTLKYCSAASSMEAVVSLVLDPSAMIV